MTFKTNNNDVHSRMRFVDDEPKEAREEEKIPKKKKASSSSWLFLNKFIF